MIKQSFLNGLVGRTVNEARDIVTLKGLRAMMVPSGSIITLEAKPKTVILWVKDNAVVHATAGDGLELEKDV